MIRPDIQSSPVHERPRVEVVEEIPSVEAYERRAFVAGAVVSGVVCAIAGVTFGFMLGQQSRAAEERR